MSYFISQESDAGFRIDPDVFVEKLRAAWPSAAVRAVTDIKRKYSHEWTVATNRGSLEGKLNRNRASVVLDGDLAACAAFAVWFQREIAGADVGLKFYDENYDPVVALQGATSEAEIIRGMTR